MKRLFLLVLSVTMVFSACGGPGKVDRRDVNGGSGASSNSGGSGVVLPDGGFECDPSVPGSPCGPDAPPPPGCGDGVLTDDEACDDGNTVGMDGCQGNCLAVEGGYSCNPPGTPCIKISRCGDGFAGTIEPCDDGNLNDGDGCNARCKIEIGYKCEGTPSVCTPTVCGDGVQEGAESCEDGNDVPFDGCSSLCQTEPNCEGDVCTSDCGDGIVIDEDCDDGNLLDGDGCSSSCTVEEGFTCSVDDGCEMRNGGCILRVPVIYRDFTAQHSDFGDKGCGAEVVTMGLVEDALSPQGKPVLAAPGQMCINSQNSFSQWYTRADGVNSQIVSELILWPNETGGFVNRYGANGEQWLAQPQGSARYCGPVGSACGPTMYEPGCTLANGEQCWDPCPPEIQRFGGCSNCACAGAVTADPYDGNPLFFPLDSHPAALADTPGDAQLTPTYGYPNWDWEDQVLPMAGGMHVDNNPANNGMYLHNFLFTTEVVYWFQYDAAATARLEFTGDDDVWVFVNGRRALDLGGLHPPLDGFFTIDGTSAGAFGLTDGAVHKITIFHAERKESASSFKLTLSGFQNVRSECSPVCGDGIVGLGEQCDDGVNDGGYGECAAGCVLGEYCGDGIVQMPNEHCDDGNRIEGDLCNNACRILVVF